MKKTVFIDRDGVINKDPAGWTAYSYVTAWGDFHFLPRAKEALKLLSDNGYDIIVISNQGGISKKYFSMAALDEITSKMLDEITGAGGRIRKVYYCPHQDSDNCACRKPKTGMFERAERELGVKARGAYFIGDGRTDVAAGEAMGMKTVLVLSGKTSGDDIAGWETKPDIVVKDLLEAVKHIIKKGDVS